MATCKSCGGYAHVEYCSGRCEGIAEGRRLEQERVAQQIRSQMRVRGAYHDCSGGLRPHGNEGMGECIRCLLEMLLMFTEARGTTVPMSDRVAGEKGEGASAATGQKEDKPG